MCVYSMFCDLGCVFVTIVTQTHTHINTHTPKHYHNLRLTRSRQ